MEQFISEVRLGDVIDDHCIKCRRITNHSIVSIVDGKAAKVRCRTCYHDHDYRNEQAPPSKKDLKRMELFKEVLSTAEPGSAEDVPGGEEPLVVEDAVPLEEAAAEVEVPVEEPPVAKVERAAPAKKTKGRTKKA